MTVGDAILERGAERLQELSDRAAATGGPAALVPAVAGTSARATAVTRTTPAIIGRWR